MKHSDGKIDMQPLVSVVINNYNYARFLRQAVDSALDQTYRNIELIVVDDGSTDTSLEILRTYEDRAIIVAKQNGGQASAFNVGIARATGEFILLLDADDYLLPEAVETCVSEFTEGYSRLYYRLRPVDEFGTEISTIRGDAYFRHFDGDMYLAAKDSSEFFWPPTSANFFLASALRTVLPVPEREYRICADAYVLAWTGLRGRVKSIDRTLGAYRLHGNNNYSAPVFRYTDRRKLKNRLDHYYNCRNLLEGTCRVAGFEYRYLPDYSYYTILKTLCVAHRYRIDSDFLVGRSTRSLVGLVLRHLSAGEGTAFGRSLRAVYLLLVLLLPLPLTELLIRAIDAKEQRRSALDAARALQASTQP